MRLPRLPVQAGCGGASFRRWIGGLSANRIPNPGAARPHDVTFLERLQDSFAQLADIVPALGGALIILFAGYLMAKLVEKGADRILRKLRLNQWLERGGVLEAVERTGAHFNPTRVLGKVLFWFVMFAVIMLAANALGMESLAGVFAELVGYIRR